MMIITDRRKEFIARYFADISKAIFAVALASKLFVELTLWLRISLPIAGVSFFILAILLLPKGGRK